MDIPNFSCRSRQLAGRSRLGIGEPREKRGEAMEEKKGQLGREMKRKEGDEQEGT